MNKSEDVIYRQAVLDTIEKFSCCGYIEEDVDKLFKAINDLPPAQPEQRWIPVSERLPDLDKYSHGKIWEQEVLITGYFSFDSKKELFIREEFASNVVNDSTGDIVVIAWMPLPKPYKAERTE